MTPRLYFAPMEGITGQIFRRAYQDCFGGPDTYFTPFIAPDSHKIFRSRELNDILPENNCGMQIVPQVLCNRSELFCETAKRLADYGYKQVNLNLGCPSKTVVTKRKGSGFLEDLSELDRFFDEVFQKCPLQVSVKTRVGIVEEAEFKPLMEIFNRYPIAELTVHPRLQNDYYNNTPRMHLFRYAYENSVNPLCYNGDICTDGEYERMVADYPNIVAVMIGRGALRNPWLFSEIRKNGTKKNADMLRKFIRRLCGEYSEVLSGERDVVFKLKELFFYLSQAKSENERFCKAVKKSVRICDLQNALEMYFEQA